MRTINDPTAVKEAIKTINEEVGSEYLFKNTYEENELSIYFIAKLSKYNICVVLDWDENGNEIYMLKEVLC